MEPSVSDWLFMAKAASLLAGRLWFCGLHKGRESQGRNLLHC